MRGELTLEFLAAHELLPTDAQVSRPGGSFVFHEWEQARDRKERHERCRAGGFRVLDRVTPDLLLNCTDAAPCLATDLITDWRALRDWTTAFFRAELAPLLEERDVHEWNFSRPTAFAKPAAGTRGVGRYFDDWNALTYIGVHPRWLSLQRENALYFSACTTLDHPLGPKCPSWWPAKRESLPTPRLLSAGPRELSRHLSFQAYGTSHGFHKHCAAWHGLFAGRKSWYMLPREVHLFDESGAERGSYDFPFDENPELQRANSVCGFKPSVDIDVRRELHTCVQAAGEVVVVPNKWWHSTCALEPYTAGSGGLIDVC